MNRTLVIFLNQILLLFFVKKAATLYTVYSVHCVHCTLCTVHRWSFLISGIRLFISIVQYGSMEYKKDTL